MNEVTPGIRCFVEPVTPEKVSDEWRKRIGWRPLRYGERVLLVDTETTTDATQRLLVAHYVLCRWADAAYERIEEALVLGDGLSNADAELIRRYATSHGRRVLTRAEFARLLIAEGYDVGTLVVGFNLAFDLGALAIPGREGWGRGRKRYRHGFLLRFLRDYTQPRLRVLAGDDPRQFIQWSGYKGVERREGRGRHAFAGRFLDLRRLAYVLWGEKTTLERACERAGVPYHKCAVRYGRMSRDLLDYLRADVDATWRLFVALREEWNALPFMPIPSPALPRRALADATPERDPSAVPPHRLQSSAGIGKGLLQAMGVRPLLMNQPDLSRETLGIFMSTLHGGWTEAHIQRVIVPVRLLDISSTYLAMAALLGLWDVLAADRLDVVDATEEVRARVGAFRPEDLLHPDAWRDLLMFCLVEPEGDVLPVQVRPGPETTWLLMMNRVHAAPGVALWWAFADVLASVARTGKAPRILRALRVVPHGRQRDLRPVSLWGVTLDPCRDPFRALLVARGEVGARLAEARAAGDHVAAQRLAVRYKALKAVAEPFAYGIYAEITDGGTPGETVRVWAGGAPIASRSMHGEQPGPYLNPLVAPFPPAACRLAMALMEGAIRERGGTWATCDTDSFAVVATEGGGLVPCPGGAHRLSDGRDAVRALSYAEVEAIRARFDALAPCGGPFWKNEPENTPHSEATRDRDLYALVVGPKRFVFANLADDDRVIVRKASAHSLGHLASPSGGGDDSWIEGMWAAAFEEARGKRGALARMPGAGLPAVSRITFTRPDVLLVANAGKNGDGPRPFSFGLTVPVEDPLTGGQAFPEGWCRRDKERRLGCPDLHADCRYRAHCPLVHPIRVLAPYDSRPGRWTRLPWRNLRTGERERLAWRTPSLPDTTPQARTFLRVSRAHLATADPRYLGPDGLPGHAGTRGEIRRQDIRLVPHPVYGVAVPLGKQNRRVEDARAGLADTDETLAPYAPEVPNVETLRAWCWRHSVANVAQEAQLARSTVERFRDGKFSTLDSASLRRLYHGLLRLDAQRAIRDQLRADLAAYLPILRRAPRAWVAMLAEVSERTVQRVLNEHSQPGPDLARRLLAIARALDVHHGDPTKAAQTVRGGTVHV